MDNLKEKTAKGLFWGALNNGTTLVLNLVIGIVLANLLSPAEYGIVGVLTIFTAIAGAIQSSGFTNGLINLKHPTDNDYNSVFWFNVITSIVLYTILFFSAPLIANFFHQPCLVSVSRLLFLSLPISAVGIACNGYLVKNLMNRELAIIGIVSLATSGAAGILLALNGYSYWSLTWQQLIYITVGIIGRFYYAPWCPSLKIDFGPVRRMFSFCVKLLVTNIVNIINQHILTFAFGRFFAISSVGNYSQANKWCTMAHSTISSTLGQIAQTVLVSVSDEHEREVRVFRKLLRFTAFLSFPALLGLAMVSHEFILLTIGEKWSESIPMLQALCLGGAFMPFYSLFQNLIISHGRSDIYMWCNIGQIVIMLILIITLYHNGIMTIVIATSILNVAWLGVWQAVTNRMAGIRLLDVLKDIVPFLVVSLLVMAVTYFVTMGITNLVLLLAARILIAVALYAGIMKLLQAKVMEECIDFIRKQHK